MKTRLLSVLLVFLLVTSVTVPAVNAEPPQAYHQAYHELHNLCLCEESEDLGHIPYLNWGIGYSARVIDQQNDKWEIFVHAGNAKKSVIITPETDLGKLITLRDFVNNVNKCKTESDQITISVGAAIGAGTGGSFAECKGFLTDDALSKMFGAVGIVTSVEEIHQSVVHFNNAKTAQKNAETLFEEL